MSKQVFLPAVVQAVVRIVTIGYGTRCTIKTTLTERKERDKTKKKKPVSRHPDIARTRKTSCIVFDNVHPRLFVYERKTIYQYVTTDNKNRTVNDFF